MEMTMPTNVVYAFGPINGDRKPIKIGTSSNVTNRLAQLQYATPHRLKLLWQVPGAYALEGALKKRFAHRCIQGEWFDFSDVDPVAEIAAATQVENDRMDAEDAAWATEHSGTPGDVFGFGGFPLVMPRPDQGGWRCVAVGERDGRRCLNWMDTTGFYEWESEWMTWVIPGIGAVQGRRYRVPQDNMPLSVLMMQVCRKHAAARRRLPAAWRPFHPRLDDALISPFQASDMEFGLMPGLERMQDLVREYAWSLIKPLASENGTTTVMEEQA
jgi:hypothetical protein